MDEELELEVKELSKKIIRKVGFVLLAVIFVFVGIPGIYVGISGNLSVPAQTVKIVKEPETFLTFDKVVSKAFVNDGEKSKSFRKWPVIPGTKIGFIEEEYSLNQTFKFEEKGNPANADDQTVKTSWLKSDRTGNKNDLKTVEGFVLYGEFTVSDWENYVKIIDPSQYAEGEKEMVKREDIVGVIIENAFQSAVQNYFPQLLTEFSARMGLVDAISKETGIKDPEEMKMFILGSMPWYWSLGISNFQQMAETGKTYSDQIGNVKIDWQAKFQAGQVTEQDLYLLCWKAYELQNKDPKAVTKEEIEFYQNVLLPIFYALAQKDMTNGFYDNDLLWSIAIEGVFKPDEESLAFAKEIVPAFLENATKVVLTQNAELANFVKMIDLKITVKFEERPIFDEIGAVDSDFQDIYQAHLSDFQ